MFHVEQNSRIFPTSQAKSVGNFPLAKGFPKADKSDMGKQALAARVRNRLTELGKGSVEAAVEAGLERNFLRDLIEGKKRSISQTKAVAVADALGWTVAQLLDTDGHQDADMRHRRFRNVPLLDQVTAGALKSPSSQIPVHDVPLLALANLGHGEFFALKVEGDSDSMDRISPPGSIIVVNKIDRALKNGRFYVFSIDGETTYKMWQEGKPAYLAPYSTNPTHKPRFIHSKRGFDVIGRVKRTLLDL